jgi:hypothetical protein
MSDSPTETATAILARLFRGSETDICTVWLDSAEDRLSDTSFHHLVISSDTLSAAKTRDMYVQTFPYQNADETHPRSILER